MYLHFISTSTSSSSNIIVLLAFSSTSLLHMLASHVKHENWYTCWKIFYVYCFRPFSKKTRTKRKSATNPPDSHSAPMFFYLVYFLPLLLFLCCGIYPIGSILACIKNLHGLLHVYLFNSFLISYSLCYFPVLHIPTPLFCARSRGTEHTTLGSLAGTHSM